MKDEIEEIKNKIVESYYRYRENIIRNYENPKYLQVVIQMKPKTFFKLVNETTVFNTGEYYYVELCGRKTPIIINDKLEEQTEFIIQSRFDYERQEREKLMEKFYKMFDR